MNQTVTWEILNPSNNKKSRKFEINLPLKDLSKFLESSWNVLSCKVNLIHVKSSDFLISSATGARKFSIADEKLYVLVVTQDNGKLLEQLKLEFKQIVNWNKYQLNVEQKFHNPYINYFTDPHFLRSK